ncbi:hypothetical protein C9994_09210 [Marivirga lumbricoides]|uniref:Type I restriction modification DNA specificity domain-containing protein n=1 Tax=Marivirga lumbricoides TaxID=1046115 RepID=A0A2T4DQC9_9BACT|nr:hypothetical protein C9994_09210 [Marivirga lumbricoides]
MNSNWESTTWGELVVLNYGKALFGYKENTSGVPVYGTNGKIGYTEKALCDFPSVIVGRKGAYRGIHFSNEPFYVIDTAFYIVPKKDINLKWAYYALSLVDINGMDSGSAIPSTSRDEFYKIPVHVPPSKEQDLMVKTLDCIEFKFNNCQSLNSTLESIAQTIFKSWFVDFDPVRAKVAAKTKGEDPQLAAMQAISGKSEEELQQLTSENYQKLADTTDLFPDEMVETEHGEIPKGWKIGSIGEIYSAKGGFAFKSKEFGDEGYAVVKIKNISTDGSVDLKNIQYINVNSKSLKLEFELMDGDVVMAMTGATVGKVGCIVKFSDQQVYLNQRVAVFKRKKNYNFSWYPYIFFRQEDKFNEIVGLAQGSAQPNISSREIESVTTVLPPSSILDHFDKLVNPLFLMWISNSKQNSTLSESRNILLPKLLSDEIELTD